jgi:hypothetical protein
MHRRLALLISVLLVLPLLPASAQVPSLPAAPGISLDVVPDPVQEVLGCDPIDPALCLLPFPNDAFTVADERTDTGRRIAFSPTAMPRNGTDVALDLGGEGKPVDPTEWNRSDGFSPGQAILTLVPGLDLPRTWGIADRARSDAGPNEQGHFDHRDQLTDIGLSLDDDAPILIINAATGELHPFWSELDTHKGVTAARQALILRPATNFEDGERYIVALRDLRDGDGQVIPAGPAFAAIRDGEGSGPRAAHLDGVLDELEEAGVDREGLYLAWDFTVASTRSLTERMLAIRDDAFGEVLGDTDLADRVVQGVSPEFVVDGVVEQLDTWTDSRGVQRSQRIRVIDGRVSVPNYLDRVQQVETQVGPQRLPFETPVPGSRLLVDPTDPDALPFRNPTQPTVRAPFRCQVPVGEGPSHGVLYGHGLLGLRDQIGDVKWPRRFGFAGCALDWWGMTAPDIPTVGAILADLSAFPSLPDRGQQGFLNFLFMGRAMVHPDGLVTDPAFSDVDGSPLLVVDEGEGTELFYDGNSQGGILGGALVAVSPDVSRAIMGVPGMNYTTLLNRSVDWEGSYGEVYYGTYQDPIERQLGLQLIQMLWDRSEANGYANRMTADPLPDTPPHDIMLQVAWSDHQVANVSAEVWARTIGAPIMVPGLPEGRHWERDPYFADTAEYPYTGSALVYWDSGNAAPPNGNVPPTEGRDPHGDPRNEPAGGWQEAHFLLTGEMADVCGGGDYLTQRHPANAGTPSCVEPLQAPGGR